MPLQMIWILCFYLPSCKIPSHSLPTVPQPITQEDHGQPAPEPTKTANLIAVTSQSSAHQFVTLITLFLRPNCGAVADSRADLNLRGLDPGGQLVNAAFQWTQFPGGRRRFFPPYCAPTHPKIRGSGICAGLVRLALFERSWALFLLVQSLPDAVQYPIRALSIIEELVVGKPRALCLSAMFMRSVARGLCNHPGLWVPFVRLALDRRRSTRKPRLLRPDPLPMDEEYSCFDFQRSFRRERSMTAPEENTENGMPAAFYRTASEDENTNDSGVSMGYDGKQPTSFKQAFDFDSDSELTPKVAKGSPRRGLREITNRRGNTEINADSPISSRTASQRKRQARESSLSFAQSMASLHGPDEDMDTEVFMHRTRSTSILEVRERKVPRKAPPTVEYSLETVENPQKEHEAFKSISGEYLARLMTSLGEEFSEKYIVIDCRFPYEYEGGHVKGAINIHDTMELEQYFYTTDMHMKAPLHNKIPIFYCEYSQKRGPTMAKELRRLDRNINAHHYPTLDFKEIYLLDRGYKRLYEVDKIYDICEPPSYTSMEDPDHVASLRKHKSKLSRSKSSRSFQRQPTLRDRMPAMKPLRFEEVLDSPTHQMSDLHISSKSPFRTLSFSRSESSMHSPTSPL
uniref:M-phase inducer phosphatase n=1 Tax=Steinernema glaseri TaxID=37863 RepID=A0A1I8AVF4_9BILA